MSENQSFKIGKSVGKFFASLVALIFDWAIISLLVMIAAWCFDYYASLKFATGIWIIIKIFKISFGKTKK